MIGWPVLLRNFVVLLQKITVGRQEKVARQSRASLDREVVNMFKVLILIKEGSCENEDEEEEK